MKWLRTPSPRAGVLAMVAALAVASALLWTHRRIGIAVPPPEPRLHWWLLAPMFALAEVVVVHVQVRREAQTISLSEIPLVIALLLASPKELAAAAVLGSGAVYVLYRRQSALKALFNVTLRLFGVTLMLFVLAAVAGRQPTVGPRGWVAALTAVAVAAAADGLLVLAVVAMHEGPVHREHLLGELIRYPLIAAAVGCLGVLAVISLHADVRSGPLLLVVCGALFAGYRAHAALNDQHVSLARLYDFGRTVAGAHQCDDIVAGVLASARDLCRAEAAELVLLGASGDINRRWVLAAGSPTPSMEEVHDDHAALWRRVLDDGEALLVPRSAARGDAAGQLSGLGYREGIIVPLGDESDIWGTLLVADRLGEVRAFHAEDIPLLKTLGNQASLALANARLLDRLLHDSLHDVLTGLANRAKFRAALQHTLGGIEGEPERSCAVLLLDLDGFKEVNDSLGHHSGDELLIHVARCLTRAASSPAVVARLGGDEFAVLLPTVSTAAGARAVTDRIQHELAQTVTIEGIEIQVRASIGIGLAPQHAHDASGLLRAADAAMYAAKVRGGGTQLYQARFADAEAGAPTENTVALLAELRRAIADRRIEPYVQPQARADTGSVTGAEALVRWDHPERGLLAPADFLGLAERHGMMHDLTGIVLDSAVATAAGWRRAGLHLRISVNLNPHSLLDQRTIPAVASALRRYGLPPEYLTLEITEGCVMSDPDQALAALTALRALGIRLSIDDFGTGYSSLSYLRRLPIHELKIDRSFVAGVTSDTQDLLIARSIIDLGTNLGLEVVAEGIEDQESWDQLAALGCHAVQGHHLARPMPAGDLQRWLQSYRDQHGVVSRAVPRQTWPRLNDVASGRSA